VQAEQHPVFATAVIANTRLLRRCTVGGLLHGGPHYASHGVKPCVHHTFTHAKALATLRDHGDLARRLHKTLPLPRQTADGIREYPEIATWLAARGPWRATVSAYDWIYHEKAQQPTGGAISMLWHQQVGPLLAGSMARYHLVEKNNMQTYPDDHPLTPRVEWTHDGEWFTQLYDLSAKVTATDKDGVIEFRVATRLVNQARKEPPTGEPACSLIYRLDKNEVLISASAPGVGSRENRPRLVLPVISPNRVATVQPKKDRMWMDNPDGKVVIEANAVLWIPELRRSRVFNPVPGFEASPVMAEIPESGTLECRIRVAPA
jgi:hypothetical protein